MSTESTLTVVFCNNNKKLEVVWEKDDEDGASEQGEKETAHRRFVAREDMQVFDLTEKESEDRT